MDALNIMPVSMKLLIGRFERISSASPLREGGREAESLAKQRANRLWSLLLSRSHTSDQNTAGQISGNDSPPVLTLILLNTVARRGAFPDIQG